MNAKVFIFLSVICTVGLTEAQEFNARNFNAHIENAILLSEQALYRAEFDEALRYVERSYFESFNDYEIKHEIGLTIQDIRVRSFQARLYQLSFQSDKHLDDLLTLLPQVETIDNERIKGKFFTMLSSFYRSKNHDLCIVYENRALDIFKSQADHESIAEVLATQLSRELDACFRDDKREEALALIPRFREQIGFSAKHSKYALAYNTRHLANIYRIYEIDQREALKLYEHSLALREEIGFKPYIPASYYSLGEVYINLEMYEPAIKAYNTSIELAEKVGFIRYIIRPNVKLGDIYSSKEDYIEAKRFYLKAINLASKNRYTDKGIDQIVDKIISIEKRN